MARDPAEYVGAVVDPINGERNHYFGACFAIGDGRHWMTADHVVEAALERGTDTLHVLVVERMMPAPASEVFRHPTLDVAVLRIAAHDADIDAFTWLADAAIGDEVSLVDPSAREVVTTSVAGHWRLRRESTAATRGTTPAPADARILAYREPIMAIPGAPGHGFSGSPVWNADGELVGMYSARDRDTDTGFALQISAAAPWLAATIQQERSTT